MDWGACENTLIHTVVNNRKTAKLLGFTIQPSLMARADQVID
jgi:hypothetical protein